MAYFKHAQKLMLNKCSFEVSYLNNFELLFWDKMSDINVLPGNFNFFFYFVCIFSFDAVFTPGTVPKVKVSFNISALKTIKM